MKQVEILDACWLENEAASWSASFLGIGFGSSERSGDFAQNRFVCGRQGRRTGHRELKEVGRGLTLFDQHVIGRSQFVRYLQSVNRNG